MDRFRLAVCIGLMIFWNAGCTPEREPPAEASKVKGTVSLDGKPVPTGEVHFVQIGVPPAVLNIKDGSFEGDAPTGDNQVEIFIYVEGPPNPRYPETPTKTNVSPEKYWGPKTALKADVSPTEPNEFKFEMSSKESRSVPDAGVTKRK
ncbi:MAG: hypothetical protein JWN70_1224 [Planctomycetaceae bacterium]|nr:hypothetical protein [Planctomycetaceae bacterium]